MSADTLDSGNAGNNWDQYIPAMIRLIMRELVAHPGEFVTFSKLSQSMNGIPPEVLHAIAEQGRNLFRITRNDKAIRLYPETFELVIRQGLEATASEASSAPPNATRYERDNCGHGIDENIIPDLAGCSLSAEMLTRTCCWKEICRLRALHRDRVDDETWKEICRIRGYLLVRQNPRGF